MDLVSIGRTAESGRTVVVNIALVGPGLLRAGFDLTAAFLIRVPLHRSDRRERSDRGGNKGPLLVTEFPKPHSGSPKRDPESFVGCGSSGISVKTSVLESRDPKRVGIGGNMVSIGLTAESGRAGVVTRVCLSYSRI